MTIQFHDAKVLFSSGHVALSADCCCDDEAPPPCGMGIDCPSSVTITIGGMTGDNGYGVPCSDAEGAYTCVSYGAGLYSSDIAGGSSPTEDWLVTLSCEDNKWVISLEYNVDLFILGALWRANNIDGCPTPGAYAFDCDICSCTGGTATLL